MPTAAPPTGCWPAGLPAASTAATGDALADVCADLHAAALPLLPYLVFMGTGQGSSERSGHDRSSLGCSEPMLREPGPVHGAELNAELRDALVGRALRLAAAALAPPPDVAGLGSVIETADALSPCPMRGHASAQLPGCCALAQAAQVAGGLAALTRLDLHDCGLHDTQVQPNTVG